MKNRFLLVLLLGALIGLAPAPVRAQSQTFKLEGPDFLLNGKPFQIMAG